MVTVSTTQKLDELLAEPVDRENFDELVKHIYDSYVSVDLAHGRIKQMEADVAGMTGEAKRHLVEKLGVLHFAMGDYETAVKKLAQVRSRNTAAHFLGRAYLELGHETEALQHLEKGRTGEDDLTTDVFMVEAHCRLREGAAAEDLLKKHARQQGDSPAFQYALGRVAELNGEYGEAMERYEAALEKDPQHAQSMFRLALNCDLNGDDQRATELYRRCVSLRPTFIGALINLGILYEDHGMHYEAIDCYKRVLAIDPRHKQAQLYLKDTESSLNMFIDISRAQRMQRMQETFSLPVSNFELSARSRGTLDKMDIKTLGGLTRVTRDELLSEKNFGDTSLSEIEELLGRYDLELGGDTAKEAASAAARELEDDVLREKLSTPVEDLDFSTRCRKCMEKLAATTVGQLIQMTEQQLLDIPNFGATSLHEVRTKLAGLGLSLKSEQ